MTSGSDLITRNWKQAECAFYEAGTGAALEVAIASLMTKQWWGVVGASAGGLAFQYAAGIAGCYDNPEQPVGPDGPGPGVDGCRKLKSGVGALYSAIDDQPMGGLLGNNIVEIVSWEPNPATGDYKDGTWWTVRYPDGTTNRIGVGGERGLRGYIFHGSDAECEETGTPDSGLPPGDIGVSTEVVDADCTWTFSPKDSYIDATGAVRVYYVVEANNDACGGPFAYWSGPNGPTPVNPNPPDCPEGEECDPIPPEPLPCCDDIKELLEQIKDCACKENGEPVEGDYRTISFISDENSPEGKRRLSKRFRYRSSSGIGLSGLVEHWRSFTWQAGAVIVAHTGSALGAPKVWAATAEEGKRVIRHAAGEAGVDADQVGRWIISGSADPRFGMPGTMRVNTKGGYYWITSRLGPDQRPLVMET